MCTLGVVLLMVVRQSVTKRVRSSAASDVYKRQDHASSRHTNTVTGYWIGEFALASGTTYGWNGQFGQFFDHIQSLNNNTGPINQLGSENSTDVFPSGSSDFATQVNVDNIVIMPPNFSQGLGNSLNITQNDPRGLIDWLQNEGQKAGIPIYIYEHWPEASSGNLNAAEWALYHEFTTGSYHQWFLWFQDALLDVYPNVDIRTIPVGPIIADILRNPAFTNVGSLSFTDFYEDNSPHGRPNIYFLAGLITYQAMYGQTVANDYSPPVDSFGGVSAEIADDFNAINAFVWERLNYYNANGVRIWP